MGLEVSLKTPYGETYNSAYVRINSVVGNNHGESSLVLFRGYLNKLAFSSGSSYFWEKEIEVNLDVSQSLWPQSYAALKSLSEFSGAVDC